MICKIIGGYKIVKNLSSFVYSIMSNKTLPYHIWVCNQTYILVTYMSLTIGGREPEIATQVDKLDSNKYSDADGIYAESIVFSEALL